MKPLLHKLLAALKKATPTGRLQIEAVKPVLGNGADRKEQPGKVSGYFEAGFRIPF